MKKNVAEMLGTFMLVFFGTGAVVANTASGGALTLTGIALVFGLVVLALIQALGDVSGAHLNPAVTVGLWIAKRLPASAVAPYVISQCIGALLASLLLHVLFPSDTGLGATSPGSGLQPVQVLVLETLLTFFLMFVILSVTVGAKEKGITAGLTIGAVVTLEIIFAGPLTGASMNPARSIGPAIVSGRLEHLWIYLIGPLLGAGMAAFVCGWIREPSAESVKAASDLAPGQVAN